MIFGQQKLSYYFFDDKRCEKGSIRCDKRGTQNTMSLFASLIQAAPSCNLADTDFINGLLQTEEMWYMPPKMETDLIGIFYVHTLLTHSQSVCDSIHCYKPFLQDYCISISYAYSVCRLSIYATVKKPALFLLHYILFVQAISLISRI